jgi:excisionase family DNA binding protein
MKKQFLSTQELGALLGVTRQTIRNWINKGDIQAFQIGQNLKIRIDEAARLLVHYGLPFPEWLEENVHHLQLSDPQASQETDADDNHVDPSMPPPPPASGVMGPASVWSPVSRNGR